MSFFHGAPPSCPVDRRCYEWARIYLQYCLCDFKDGAALFLGIISIISWGVAEVPQIVTNYKEKSTEGLSLVFLLTWTIGDLFNLIGCQLEPATLPTQYYVALLYTVTTLFLTAQTIYYGHIKHRLKEKNNKYIIKKKKYEKDDTIVEDGQTNLEKKSGLIDSHSNHPKNASGGYNPTSPIPVKVNRSQDYHTKDLYYTSARSLSKSPLPTYGSWLAQSHEQTITEPLLIDRAPATAPPSNYINLLSVVPSVTMFLAYYLLTRMNTETPGSGTILLVGRKLLQENNDADRSSGIGTLLGWLMAAIYMGGRLPQILLNIKRGNVQGLNPLMFVFALVGNATYVASILVNSMEWSVIQPNLPWLVDAGGCVALDTFILIQFAYFHLRKLNDIEDPSA